MLPSHLPGKPSSSFWPYWGKIYQYHLKSKCLLSTGTALRTGWYSLIQPSPENLPRREEPPLTSVWQRSEPWVTEANFTELIRRSLSAALKPRHVASRMWTEHYATLLLHIIWKGVLPELAIPHLSRLSLNTTYSWSLSWSPRGSPQCVPTAPWLLPHVCAWGCSLQACITC